MLRCETWITARGGRAAVPGEREGAGAGEGRPPSRGVTGEAPQAAAAPPAPSSGGSAHTAARAPALSREPRAA